MVRRAFVLLLLHLVLGKEKTKEESIKLWKENNCKETFRNGYSPISALARHLTVALNTVSYPVDFLQRVMTADLQETNIFEEFIKIFPRRSTTYLPRYELRQFLQIGGYFGTEIDYIYDYDDYDNQMFERKGTVEEYVVFMLGHIEQVLEQEISRNVEYMDDKYLANRLKNINETMTANQVWYSQSYKYFCDNLEDIFSSHGAQVFFTYDSRQEWNDWAANKLSNVLKNMAFFGRYHVRSSKKTALDVKEGLQWGLFTFILERPKVLQSPKVKPVLRMAMAKFIAESDDFGKQLFQNVSCFPLAFNFSSILRPFLGLGQEDVWFLLESLQGSYEGSLSKISAGQRRDPEPWIDLMDAMIKEIEKIDIDELFYEFYAIILKTKHFLYRIDHDGGLGPSAMKLVALLEKPYVLLTSGKWPTMWMAIKEVMAAAKSSQFWKEINKAYKEYSNENWGEDFFALDFGIDFLRRVGVTVTKELKIQTDFSDFFQLLTTDTGRKYFKITDYLKTVRSDYRKSLFQPNLEFIDMRYFLKKMVGELRSIQFLDHFEPIISELLLKNIELTPADYDMVKKTKETVLETINEIMSRVIIND